MQNAEQVRADVKQKLDETWRAFSDAILAAGAIGVEAIVLVPMAEPSKIRFVSRTALDPASPAAAQIEAAVAESDLPRGEALALSFASGVVATIAKQHGGV